MVYHDIEELSAAFCKPCCVTIGNFDGVHKGHQALIERVRRRARAEDLHSVVITFDPHPLRVLVGKKTPPFITLTLQKLELLEKIGVDFVFCQRFSKELAGLDPEVFVFQHLVRPLGMKKLIIGHDYAFGKGRRGNFPMLQALGEKYGFEVERLEPVLVDGAIVSSTRVRDLIEQGEVWRARDLIGRFYQVQGAVKKGKQRGGPLLGFPTANLVLSDELCPKTGVYAVWAEIKGRVHPAVANIGYNPTFGSDCLSVEVHIMDLDSDLYGEMLRVHFVQRLRSEKKFSSFEELKAQITEDVQMGRKILAAEGAALVV
ncbi:MAG: bifunctional riboflavin kinase/FAD synthetase [Desulfonatronovibrionaceae bacterium]